jgi:hypothetical protein
MKKIKKNREEIESLILDCLEEKPLSVQQLSEKTCSNWSTINEIIKKLENEGKIREIISTGKIRVYKNSDYPVFFSLPIQKKHKDCSIFLFSEIIKAWQKKHKAMPPATTIQKIGVDVVKDINLDLPVLPFHYGMVLPIFSVPSGSYKYEIPSNSKDIILSIEKIIPHHTEKAWKEELNQYKKYDMPFFLAKNKLSIAFEGKDKKEIENSILKLSSEFPSNEENANIFELFDRYVSCSLVFLNWKKNIIEISELKRMFEKLWDIITANMFFNEARKSILREDIQLFDILKASILNSKISMIEYELSNFKAMADSVNPEEIDIPMDNLSIRIREILTDNADYE